MRGLIALLTLAGALVALVAALPEIGRAHV